MSDLHQYKVTWEVDIEAETPVLAALQALEMQRRPDSTATVFEVTGNGGFVKVDLDEEAESRNETVRELLASLREGADL